LGGVCISINIVVVVPQPVCQFNRVCISINIYLVVPQPVCQFDRVWISISIFLVVPQYVCQLHRVEFSVRIYHFVSERFGDGVVVHNPDNFHERHLVCQPVRDLLEHAVAVIHARPIAKSHAHRHS
jgi:hypothetical protein